MKQYISQADKEKSRHSTGNEYYVIESKNSDNKRVKTFEKKDPKESFDFEVIEIFGLYEDEDLILEFKSGVYLTETPESIKIQNCIFNENFEINSKTVFSIQILNSNFNKALIMHECDIEKLHIINNKKYKFKSNINTLNISASTIKYQAKFLNYSINYFFLKHTTFENQCTFFRVEFNMPTSFNLVNFYGITLFDNVLFRETINFTSCNISNKTKVNFISSNFNKLLNISEANFSPDILNFWNINFEQEDKITNLLKNESIIQHYPFNLYEEKYNISKNGKLLFLKEIRETFRIIKASFEQNKNTIDSYKFHKYEMITFKEENREQGNKDFRLWLNYWSNEYGTSYYRPLTTTIIISLFIYCLFLCLTDKTNVLNFIQYISGFFEYITLTKWKFTNFTVNSSSLIILIIGRIILSYGIYQFITAFRMYRKR